MPFAANPFGIQWDALWTEARSAPVSPPTTAGSILRLTRSEGRLTGRGYLVLMAIPFKSLRFPSTGQQEWGIILNRSIRAPTRTCFGARLQPHPGTLQPGRHRDRSRVHLARTQHPIIPYRSLRSFATLINATQSSVLREAERSSRRCLDSENLEPLVGSVIAAGRIHLAEAQD